MINHRCNTRPVNRQHGVALITGLIFLVVLTLISVTAARMSSLEERMSGNMRDRSLAMQAAEMALRDAERDIRGGAGITRAPAISGLTNFNFVCTAGLCYNGPAGNANGTSWIINPVWSLPIVNNMTAAPSVAYGTYTGAIGNVALSAQPRYIIEGIEKNGSGTTVYYYRITVRAQGANANTVVRLQEVYRP